MIHLADIKRDIRAIQKMAAKVITDCEEADLLADATTAEVCRLVDDALGLLLAAEDMMGLKRLPRATQPNDV